MKPSEIENWAHQVMDLVESGHAVEDGRVELKREWIEAEKAARQIAAHANAARGEPILWLVGVDEKQGVIGVRHEEFSNWFSSVTSCFEGIPPNCSDLNVPRKGGAIAALLFDTIRAPFVVKNPQYGKTPGDVIALEVPWREGRKTRSARREELLRLLVPITHVPAIEWLEAILTVFESTPTKKGEPTVQANDRRFTWNLRARLYAEPASDLRLVIPFHRCEVRVRLPGQIKEHRANTVQLSPPTRMTLVGEPVGFESDSRTIAATTAEVILEGPGMLLLDANVHTGLPGEFDAAGAARIWIRLRGSGLEKPVDSVLNLEPDLPARKASSRNAVIWKFQVGEE